MPWQLAPNFIRGSDQAWEMFPRVSAYGFEPLKPLLLSLPFCLGIALILNAACSSVDAPSLTDLSIEEPQVISTDHAYSPETDDLVAMACRRNREGDASSDLNRCRETAID